MEKTRTRRAKEAAERELLESRDRLANLLEQKTALLHEVSHRVSNSLQLIGSLISIQAARISDPSARDALLQARERVQAVMLVHRRLYTSDEVASIEIDKYLIAMAEELQAGVLAAEQGHRIIVSAAPLRISTDKAVSVGVIVNELITNALKYAFPGGKDGTIRIGLESPRDGQILLTVEDDGTGYAETAAPKGTGLGTLIIGAMAKTLQGSVERQPAETGSRTVLSFPMA
jgi:two-component sensor histidine kinase